MNWSGHWNHVHNDGHKLIGTRNPLKRLGRALAGKTAQLDREIVKEAVSGMVGETVETSYTRLTAQTEPRDNGGVRSIETVTQSKTITQNDVDEFIMMLDQKRKPMFFPVEASGNSGGGKLGF